MQTNYILFLTHVQMLSIKTKYVTQAQVYLATQGGELLQQQHGILPGTILCQPSKLGS